MIDVLASHSGQRTAILDEVTGCLTYSELNYRVASIADKLRNLSEGSVTLCLLPTGGACISYYLGALAARRPVILVEPGSAAVDVIIDLYKPAALAQALGIPVPAGYLPSIALERYGIALCIREDGLDSHGAHPSLALLLTTSGSTGNPKLVRLSLDNLYANARSIVDYLGIGTDDVALQSLPLQYSYGLSLLNSHLVAGGAIAIPKHSFMRPEFWGFAAASRATSFAGVPYMYETLHRLRVDPFCCPSLRTATQAGGALKHSLVQAFWEASIRSGKRFFVMYGQTEATARIAYVPADRLGDKIGAIGVPIPQGHLSLREVPSIGERELVYSGPNVMLGYAETATDLRNGDVQQGILHTGDLGTVDADGFFWATGRLARFAKLFGRRIHLGDVEAEAEQLVGRSAAAIEKGNMIVIFVEGGLQVPEGSKLIRATLAAKLGVPPTSISVTEVERIPRTSAGKKNYKELAR